MGTTWHATLASSGSIANDAATLIQTRLDELEALFSNWLPDSAVSRFNTSSTTDWQPVPRELAEVMAFAQELSRETKGAFDVTVSPLIDLWGFGAKGLIHTPPTDAAIAAAKARCGWQKLEVKTEPPMLRKSLPELQINVSALVEGYAVDDLVKRLRARGIHDFLLDVGGELFASGVKADGSDWQVGVQQPQSAKGEVVGTMPLFDKALATSGTYRQFFEHDGRRYSHVLDARTGWPLEHTTVSVSVIADSCLAADGWATALLVLGPGAGGQAAGRRGLSAMFLTGETSGQ